MTEARSLLDGCVLAGGPGRRLGGPKAGALLAGRSLVERAVDLLDVRCGRVVVVTRPDVALPPLHAPVIFDRPGPDAPLVALVSAFAALDADDVLVLACDLPLAGPMLDRLLAAPPGEAVAGVEGGRLQPLCARYPRRAALAVCERLLEAGALPARGLPEALGARGIEAPVGALLNVNTPEDLARAEMILGPAAA